MEVCVCVGSSNQKHDLTTFYGCLVIYIHDRTHFTHNNNVINNPSMGWFKSHPKDVCLVRSPLLHRHRSCFLSTCLVICLNSALNYNRVTRVGHSLSHDRSYKTVDHPLWWATLSPVKTWTQITHTFKLSLDASMDTHKLHDSIAIHCDLHRYTEPKDPPFMLTSNYHSSLITSHQSRMIHLQVHLQMPCYDFSFL